MDALLARLRADPQFREAKLPGAEGEQTGHESVTTFCSAILRHWSWTTKQPSHRHFWHQSSRVDGRVVGFFQWTMRNDVKSMMYSGR
jgi:hypothetical protein